VRVKERAERMAWKQNQRFIICNNINIANIFIFHKRIFLAVGLRSLPIVSTLEAVDEITVCWKLGEGNFPHMESPLTQVAPCRQNTLPQLI